MSSEVRFFLTVVFVMAAMVFAFVTFIIFMNSAICETTTQRMGIIGEYSPYTGCMAKLNDRWIMFDDVIPIERGGHVEFTTKPYVRMDVNR